MSKIIKLTSENVKRLSAVEITPQGNVVVIGGQNGQGKSSVLDSIQYALGGEPDTKMPVRKGQEKAKIILDLGDLVVKRTFTAGGGSTLVVTNAEGVKQFSPQTILDKLVGKLTFDPLEFARMKPTQQAVALAALVGLDFTKQDAEHAKLYAERTVVNREAKQLEALLTTSPKHQGVPEEETSAASILDEQQRAQEKNEQNRLQRLDAVAATETLKAASGNIDGLIIQQVEVKGEIEELQKRLALIEQGIKTLRDGLPELEKTANQKHRDSAVLQDVDMEQFKSRISEVEATNTKIRQNKVRADRVNSLKAKNAAEEKLTSALDKIVADKRRMTTEAKYPVEGMLFDAAGGITLNGIPFEQCSSAEQLKVSVAIGLALNPTLKVLLVRDGSLLDENSLAMLVKMAADADAQVWIEMVGTNSQTSVVIEDGHIKIEDETETEKP